MVEVVSPSISDQGAMIIAQSLLQKRPSGVVAYQNQKSILSKIAVSMHVLNPTVSIEEHLQTIYNVILAIVLSCERRRENFLSAASTVPTEVIMEKTKECITESFLEYFDKQVLGTLGKKTRVSFLSDKRLHKARLHIELHNCHSCRSKLATLQGPAIYAQTFFHDPTVDHDYSDLVQ